MDTDMALVVLRQLLLVGSGVLVAKGWGDDALWQALTGVVMGVATAVVGWLSRRKLAREAGK